MTLSWQRVVFALFTLASIALLLYTVGARTGVAGR